MSPKNHPKIRLLACVQFFKNLENIKGFFKISPMFFKNIENLKDLSLNASRISSFFLQRSSKKRLNISMISSKIFKTLGPRMSSFFSNVFQNYWKSQGGAGFLPSTVSINHHYEFRHMTVQKATHFFGLRLCQCFLAHGWRTSKVNSLCKNHAHNWNGWNKYAIIIHFLKMVEIKMHFDFAFWKLCILNMHFRKIIMHFGHPWLCHCRNS